MSEVVLVDLSSIAHPIWHQSQAEPDPNHTSQQIVARVRALASGQPHVAICCDSGKSFRHDLTPTYKANRPEHEEPLRHQIKLACEMLAGDGFPIWSVKGFEADDIIASAVKEALVVPDATVLIVTADKDLLQLVGPRVRAMSARDGAIADEAEVETKFGVKPAQIRDYLTLVGDASDNIKGAAGIGPKKAAELLKTYGTLDNVYTHLFEHGTLFKPAMATALREFFTRVDDVRALVTLRTDVPIPFAEIATERVVKDVEPLASMEDEMDLQKPTVERPSQGVTDRGEAAKEEVTDLPGNGAPKDDAPSASRLNSNALAVVPQPELPMPLEYERQLDPRSLREAIALANHMHQSRLFSAYGTPQGVLSTVMLGRELGMPAMASLRGVHVIEGKHSLSADTMVALVLKSGLAEYFDPIEFDMQHATFETFRKGGRKPITLTYTIEHAKQAGLVKAGSGWEKRPEEMLIARAKSRLARLVYPDIVGGLYTPDELREARAEVA